MADEKDTNSIEEMEKALEDAFMPFNKSVKKYLKGVLRTEEEQKAADKVRIHLGMYIDLEENRLMNHKDSELNKFSIAMVCEGEKCRTILNPGGKVLKQQQWWENTLRTDSFEMWEKEKSVNNSLTDDFIGEVELILVGEIKTKKILLRDRILLEILLDILNEIIKDIQGIKNIQELLGEWKEREHRKLIEIYVEKVFEYYKEYPILEEKDCIRLSHEKYEGREKEAKIYIGGKKREILAKSKQSGEIICWGNGWKLEAGETENKTESDRLEKRKIRYYRKMMELCKNNKCLITCFNEKGKINILGAADKKWLNKNNYKIHIDFNGNGEWYIREDREDVLCYIKGIYYYSQTGVARLYKTQLKNEAGLEEDMVKKFCEIIKCLSQQEHGAGMVVVENARNIAEGFCRKYNRGTVLNEALDLTDGKNREFLQGMTSMDGMLLVDKKGGCHAFGVILDGEVKIEANLARGSRYNSAANYIYDKEGSFAVIVSEDKTVDIIGRSIRESIKAKESQG